MKKETVLVVEDHPLNMKLVRSLLHPAGFQVLEADNADQAIQMASSLKPDLVLMDIQLPDMDGLEATRIIKSQKESAHIPVIALTSYAMPGDELKASEAGCSGYITKPIDTRGFIRTIKNFLDPGIEITEKPEQKERTGRPRILIVDDDLLNIKLLKAKLPQNKFEPLSAQNGEQALRMAVNEIPDLILLDIMMPGMDGFEVSRKLRSNPLTQEIPIIVVTALEGLDDKVRGLEAGADEFLNKPVNTIELLARINSLLRLKKYRERLTLRNKSEKLFFQPQDFKKRGEETEIRGKILLVEDNDKDIQMFLRYFDGSPYSVTCEQSGEAALARLEREPFDLLLLDVLLPGIDGFEVCRRLKNMKQTRDLQIILVTCLPHLENKIKGIELGADDYLIKPVNCRELKARAKVLMNKKQHMDVLQKDYETAINSSITDGLTGLYNQAYFKKYLDQELRRSSRQHYPISLILLDIDDFKNVNDRLGHQEGDRVLKNLASIIKNAIREIDFSARYGGDEFVLVLPYADQEETLQIAERVQKTLREGAFHTDSLSDQGILTVSMGIALLSRQDHTAESLIRNADLALYQAKGGGKNQICFFEISCKE